MNYKQSYYTQAVGGIGAYPNRAASSYLGHFGQEPAAPVAPLPPDPGPPPPDPGASFGPEATVGAGLSLLYTAGWLAGTGLGAMHGYKKHNDSFGWAIGWGILGGLFWPITVPVLGYKRLKK